MGTHPTRYFPSPAKAWEFVRQCSRHGLAAGRPAPLHAEDGTVLGFTVTLP